METREQYQKRTEAKLEELEPKIWKVKARAEEMTDEAQAEYQRLFQVLYAKLEQVGQALQELEGANEGQWPALRAQVDGALSDLNNSVGNVLARMG